MKKHAFLLTLIALGCHAQVPPTNHTVTLTWTAPQASGSWAGCTTSAPCSYVLSRAVLASGTNACPATTGSSYTPLNAATPATGTTYTDASASGETACYIAQTIQGSAVSEPSNTAGPVVVPGNPSAPSLGAPAIAQNEPLKPSGTEVAEASPLKLKVHIR